MRVENSCRIYLDFGGKFVIPVNPKEIEIARPTDHNEYDVLGVGQVVVPKKPALKEISWESFFPGDLDETFTNSGAKRPKFYVDKLEKAMNEKTKGRVIISRSGLFDTNIRCVIEEFATTDQGGEPHDVYYDIKLREYRDAEPQVVQVIKTAAAEQAAEVTAEAERPVETPVLRVGAQVIANGKYWYDSYGSKPFGTANNITTQVTRIASGNPYPVHIGHYGWLAESQLQVIG